MRFRNYIQEAEKAKELLLQNIFNVLVEAKILGKVSVTTHSKVPFYQFTMVYDRLRMEMPEEADYFLKTFQKLLQNNFILILVVDKLNHHIQFMQKSDYEKLDMTEKIEFSIIPKELVLNNFCMN